MSNLLRSFTFNVVNYCSEALTFTSIKINQALPLRIKVRKKR